MPEAKKATAVAKATTTPVAKKAEQKPRVKVDMECKYESTGKYNPKAKANIESLAAVEKVLPATYKEIQAVIPQHMDFVGYLIRREALAPK